MTLPVASARTMAVDCAERHASGRNLKIPVLKRWKYRTAIQPHHVDVVADFAEQLCNDVLVI
jgi:hypothetical protein